MSNNKTYPRRWYPAVPCRDSEGALLYLEVREPGGESYCVRGDGREFTWGSEANIEENAPRWPNGGWLETDSAASAEKHFASRRDAIVFLKSLVRDLKAKNAELEQRLREAGL